jgi:anaerobic selenocysteine-containing dehydrogenase
LAEVHPELVEHRSFCRLCMASCGIVVTTNGDRVVGIRGDTIHPVSRGYTCSKGRTLGEVHHSPSRLDHPLLGRGDDARAVDWATLMDDLATRLQDVLGALGPSGVGVYFGTGTVWDAAGRRNGERFVRALGTPQQYSSVTIDTPCKPLIQELMGGSPVLMPLLDWDRARFAILIGSNPVVSHGHSNPFPDPVARLRDIASRGALWVIDPRRTETAQLATRHLAIRPGTDHVLVGALVRRLLEDGEHADYLESSAAGVEVLERCVARFTADRAAAVCGVPRSEVEALLDDIRRFGPANAQTGTGTTMSVHANLVEWLVWSLNIVTESHDRPGGMWFNPGFLKRFETREVRALPPEPGPVSRPELRRRLGEYPTAALVDEIEAGNLRALIVAGGAPVTAFPDTARTIAALGQLDVLAVADVLHNPTTRLATHVLACTGPLERADVPYFTDNQLPAVYTQYAPAIVPPVGDRRPLWWQFAKLAELVGLDLLDGRKADDCNDDDVLRLFASRGRVSFDELRDADGPVVAQPTALNWVEERLPDGRWNMAPAELVAQLARTPDPVPHQLVLIPRRERKSVNSLRGPDVDAASESCIWISPSDADDRGVKTGNDIVVESNTGSLCGVALVTDRVARGTVSVVHGNDPNVSQLTSNTECDLLTGMVQQSGVPVVVRLAADEAGRP